jgi:hypothetical protein
MTGRDRPGEFGMAPDSDFETSKAIIPKGN